LTTDDPASWFAERGWLLSFTQEAEFTWAHLTAADNADFVVPRYGRGGDEAEAAQRARRRWEVEQIGSSGGGP
jgi:hypothetical protein